jgi:phage shock protein A
MPHFSRLTDIITCSITEILNASKDPSSTLNEIIEEINEGLTACRRNVRTSVTNSDRLRREISAYELQIVEWKNRAKQFLSDGEEDGARDSLRRKVEVEDLIDGLRPELDAAANTHQQMLRIQKALEARLAEAQRTLEEMTGTSIDRSQESESAAISASAISSARAREVEAELEALKKELGS